MLKRLFLDLYKSFEEKDCFQEAFGYFCVDDGYVSGILGSDIEAQLFRLIRKENLWPVNDKCKDYSEDDLFDVIEFLYDYVSMPKDGTYHQYGNCGWHYSSFDKLEGQKEFRSHVNELLRDYSDGFEINVQGEILVCGEPGLEPLFQATVPSKDPENISARVQSAISKYRRSRSSLDERRDAIRDLADVFEFLRPRIKTVLMNKDENDLFILANSFGIRHHNEKQKTEYDKPIWYSWMFYYYLATIHAILRLIEKQEESEG